MKNLHRVFMLCFVIGVLGTITKMQGINAVFNDEGVKSSSSARAQDMSSSSSVSGLELKKQFLHDRNHPEVRAFLDTIALPEGTYKSGLQGYLMRYPAGVTIKSFDSHPETVMCRRSYNSNTKKYEQLCSSAAGRYMFLLKTWERIAKILNLTDFSPLNQDIGALYLMHEKDALYDVKRGNFRGAITKVNDVWASLPGAPYGQPTMDYKKLEQFYTQRLDHYKKYLPKKGGQS